MKRHAPGCVRQGPRAMSSQSTARAPRIRTEPRSAPVKSVAYTYASSPESLWVHSTPACARLAAIPELSFTRGLCSHARTVQRACLGDARDALQGEEEEDHRHQENRLARA